LRPAVEDRPSAAELLRDTKANYKRHRRAAMEAQRNPANPPEDFNVRLTNGEMNDLRDRGDAVVHFHADNEPTRDFFRSLRKQEVERCGDPDDPPLCPPRELWQVFYDNFDPEDAVLWQRKRGKNPPEANMEADKALMHRADWFERVGDWAYVAAVGDEPRPRAKRMRDWQEADHDDHEVRGLLRIIRAETADYTDDKPVVLLEHILNTERQDVDATIDILKWLYNRSRKAPLWTEKKRVQTIAKNVQNAWQKKFPGQRLKPSYRECLYFAGSAPAENLGVSFLLEKMAGFFRADDAADNNDQANQDERQYDLDRNENIRLLRSLIAHVAQERPLLTDHWSDDFLAMILEGYAGDAHLAFDRMKAYHLLELTPGRQAWMLEARPPPDFMLPKLDALKILLVRTGSPNHPVNARTLANNQLLARALMSADLDQDQAAGLLVRKGEFLFRHQEAAERRQHQMEVEVRRREQEARERREQELADVQRQIAEIQAQADPGNEDDEGQVMAQEEDEDQERGEGLFESERSPETDVKSPTWAARDPDEDEDEEQPDFAPKSPSYAPAGACKRMTTGMGWGDSHSTESTASLRRQRRKHQGSVAEMTC
jgi:hypothetical protein